MGTYVSSFLLPGHGPASSWWKESASESGTGRHLCKEEKRLSRGHGGRGAHWLPAWVLTGVH